MGLVACCQEWMMELVGRFHGTLVPVISFGGAILPPWRQAEEDFLLERNVDMSLIETSRLILRPFEETDAPDASRNSMRPLVARYLSDMVLETEQEALEWIQGLKEQANLEQPFQVLAIELKGEQAVIGLVGVHPKRQLGGELEILYAVADEYQGRGIATEAVKAMIWWTFEVAGQDVISAIVKPENRASRRVIEKLGFVYGDTRMLWHDGKDCRFDYFRLYHTDHLPGPEWDLHSLYGLEPMGAFFDVRAEEYNRHMLSDGGESSYQKLGSFIPKTAEAVEILDIGCGTGIELDYLGAQAPNARITCVDLSQGMLDLLLKSHWENRERIAVVKASYLDWRYPENAFDLAVSSATMHHLWPMEKLAVYRKLLNTLKPGGSYLENDFMVDAIQQEQYRRRYERITAGLPEEAKAGEYHIDIPLTVETQVKLLKEAGFQRVEVLDESIKPRGSGAILKAVKAKG